MKTATTLLILLTLFSFNTFAQDYTQWGLPDGAKMRLGKGRLHKIQYSPDGTRLAVASTIGVWVYDTTTYQEVALLTGQEVILRTGHTDDVFSVAFSPSMALPSLVAVALSSVSGTRGRAHTYAHSRGIRRMSLALRSVHQAPPSLVVVVLPSVSGTRGRAHTYAHSRGIRIGSIALRSVHQAPPSLVVVMIIPSVSGTRGRARTYGHSRGIRIECL